jgi:hypothetical protein
VNTGHNILELARLSLKDLDLDRSNFKELDDGEEEFF